MENDLIRREYMIERIRNSGYDEQIKSNLYLMARMAPAVDAVEVVRCPSCKFHEDIDGYHECRRLRMRCPNDAEFFCKYGRHRKEGTDA